MNYNHYQSGDRISQDENKLLFRQLCGSVEVFHHTRHVLRTDIARSGIQCQIFVTRSAFGRESLKEPIHTIVIVAVEEMFFFNVVVAKFRIVSQCFTK